MPATRLVSIAALVVTTVASTAVLLAAQRTAPLTAGTRIRMRFRTATHPIVGTLDTISSDTVRFRPEDPRTASRVALSTIEGIDVSRGRHSNMGKGALWGGVVMGALSATVAAAMANAGERDLFRISGGEAVEVTVVGTALGAGVGALIGSLVRSEKWEPAPLSSLRVAPVSLNRVAITVSLVGP